MHIHSLTNPFSSTHQRCASPKASENEESQTDRFIPFKQEAVLGAIMGATPILGAVENSAMLFFTGIERDSPPLVALSMAGATANVAAVMLLGQSVAATAGGIGLLAFSGLCGAVLFSKCRL